VENTHNRAGGRIYPLENIRSLSELAKKYNLKYHLDGARLWNASVVSGISPAEYSSYFDSVSVCLSKGLGAPVGSVIASDREFIKQAYRVRKAWGGGMRQVGILAAAGLYAVQNNIERLAEDHKKAKRIGEFLSESPNVELDIESLHTNILIFKVKSLDVETALSKCKELGLLLSVGSIGSIRAVTHMDVSDADIDEAIKIMKNVFNN
jgi:threonine aldolase